MSYKITSEWGATLAKNEQKNKTGWLWSTTRTEKFKTKEEAEKVVIEAGVIRVKIVETG